MADTNLKLLAYVPNLMDSARKYCAQREAKFPYFRDGYVDLALGRHTNWTDAIRQATEGYAIADGAGTVQATYKSLKNADRAMEIARPRFLTELELEPEEEVPAKPAKTAKTKTAAASAGA
jgi:hypothetical protein